MIIMLIIITIRIKMPHVNSNCFMWTVDNWLWLTLVGGENIEKYFSILREMKWDQTTSHLYISMCIALMPSLPFLAAFAVRSLLAVLLCQAATNEESSSWEYSCAWHQLRTLRKKLGRRGCGNYWFFLTSSFFSILPRCAPSNTSFIRKHALWGCLTVFSVKYFRE